MRKSIGGVKVRKGVRREGGRCGATKDGDLAGTRGDDDEASMVVDSAQRI